MPTSYAYAIFGSVGRSTRQTLAGRGVGIPKNYRTNERIRVPEVRLVDEDGGQLGVVPIQEALSKAKERQLDLVEVAASASPPVCRLMDYGRFRYEATRKEREARKLRKTKASNELRQVRFKTRIGEHDRGAKTRQVSRLLDEGSKVKVTVMFRGREMDHPEVGMRLLKLVADDLVDEALLERPPAFEGRMLSMTLSPDPAKATRDAKTEKELDRAKA